MSLTHTFDMSKLTRRKPNMEINPEPTNVRMDYIVAEARKELKQLTGKDLSVCMDKAHQSDWEQRPTLDKIKALVEDTLWWGGH